jgi:hypothetical protein
MLTWCSIQKTLTVTEIFLNTSNEKKAVHICSWFDAHERLQKLHQQAILEARELREESVKEMIISYNKVSTGFICTN